MTPVHVGEEKRVPSSWAARSLATTVMSTLLLLLLCRAGEVEVTWDKCLAGGSVGRGRDKMRESTQGGGGRARRGEGGEHAGGRGECTQGGGGGGGANSVGGRPPPPPHLQGGRWGGGGGGGSLHRAHRNEK